MTAERPELDEIEKRHEQISASAHLKVGYAAAAHKSAADIPSLLAYTRTLEARIEKALDLHTQDPWIDEGPEGSEHIRGVYCETCRESWPCPTSAALGGAS